MVLDPPAGLRRPARRPPGPVDGAPGDPSPARPRRRAVRGRGPLGGRAPGGGRAARGRAAVGRGDQGTLRAVARDLEERAVVEELPGRTADELAAEAGRALPGFAGELAEAARLFDDVTYGDLPGTPRATGAWPGSTTGSAPPGRRSRDSREEPRDPRRARLPARDPGRLRARDRRGPRRRA
ncbi:DUF4129 domain-containing protein, partial [Planomonospora algeriensis]